MPALPFRDLIGQEPAVERLRRAFAGRRFPHAVLFVGEEGTGRKALARAAAGLLLCEGPVGDACGECRACRWVAGGSHPDLLWVEESEGTVGIDRVRELKTFLSRSPAAGPRRVAVAGPGERITEAAQNALLKVLEEPPGEAVILLWAASEEGLLVTLVSRALVIPVQTVPAAQLAQLLIERAGLAPADARTVAVRSRGRAGWALRRGAHLLELDRLAGEVFSALTGGEDGGRGLAAAFGFAETWAKDPARDELLTLLEGWFLDRVRASVTGGGLGREPAAALRLLLEARRDLGRGVYPRIALDRAFYRIALLFAGRSSERIPRAGSMP